jgi:hypothetical protein
MQAHGILRYAPRGAGLTAAAMYVNAGDDVYGWYAGAKDQTFTATYFALEAFYSTRETRLFHSVEDDLYGPWVEHTPRGIVDIRTPIPEAWVHELDRLQGAFVDEWLFFGNAPSAAADIEAYARLGLPVRDVNVQSRQFGRFDRSQPVWRYVVPGTDINVIEELARVWTLDDRCEAVPLV